MRISSSRPTTQTRNVRKADKSEKGASSFRATAEIDGGDEAGAVATGGVAGIGAVDAVMALQSVDTIGERRQRSLRKGRRMLNALDRLQISVLDNTTSKAHLGLLKRSLEVEREQTGDDGLDDALAQIEVRAAVEIAKLERQQKAN